MDKKKTPLFDKPQDEPTEYDGLLGWATNWKCYLDPKERPIPLDEVESLNASKDSVIIKRGDTISRIAKDNNCTVNEIIRLNNIKNPQLIYPGQTLKLPTIEYAYSDLSPPDTNSKCELSFTFEDLINKPIPNLKIRIESATAVIYDSITDSMGKIEKLIINSEKEVRVLVLNAAGKIKEVANFLPIPGKTDIILSSPKVRIKGQSAAINGMPGDIDKGTNKNNTVSIGRDSKGNPSLQLNHMCPNRYDLSLGKNIIYYEHIIAAAKRSGFIPQSIAALINAESAKYPGGVWKQDSLCFNSSKINAEKKRRKGLGLEPGNDVFYKSSAAGMTQFLNLTWIGEILRSETYLNEKAVAAGIVAEKPSLDKHGRERVRRDGTPILENKFQVSPNVWKNLYEIKKSSYTSGITPYPSLATQTIQNWLNLRFKAEYSIMAAVDYGLSNLAFLKKTGFKIDSLNDAEKAKIIYLTHHLGLTDAIRFIQSSIAESSAKNLLIAQIGSVKAAAYASDNDNSYMNAHRQWLSNFVNFNIVIDLYYCPEVSKEKTNDVNLFDVIKKIK